MIKLSKTGRYVIWERYHRGYSRKWKPHRPLKHKDGCSWNEAVQMRIRLRKHNRIDTWGFRIEPMGYDPNKEK